MSDNTVILEVNDLHKSYGDHEVLKGISTTIKKGDVLALIGPSGCGKSTFLRSLNLLEVPTSGHVLFEGTDMTDASVDINHVREKIGMVFQQFNLFPNMTIRENIMLAPVKLGKMTKEEAAKKAEDLLARIGLRLITLSLFLIVIIPSMSFTSAFFKFTNKFSLNPYFKRRLHNIF